MVTTAEFVKAYNYLADSGDSRIMDIPAEFRYRDDANRRVVDLRDQSTGTFTEQEITDALNLALTDIAEQQAIDIAQTVNLEQARRYLQRQLSKASPNLTTIYTTIKSNVDANAVLSQMVDNQIALMSNSITGFTVDTVTPTGVDRQRYILCVQMVIATLG